MFTFQFLIYRFRYALVEGSFVFFFTPYKNYELISTNFLTFTNTIFDRIRSSYLSEILGQFENSQLDLYYSQNFWIMRFIKFYS